jgi:hypothetical protein
LDHDKKAFQVLNYRKRHFDAPISEEKLPDLQHLLITMNGQPAVLAASALFSTGSTEGGDLIGPTLNVVPVSEDKSVAVISYPIDQEAEIEAALPEVFYGDESGLTYELAKLLIQRVENFTLSPAHCVTWSDDKKARVLREFEANMMEPKEIADHEDLNIFL